MLYLLQKVVAAIFILTAAVYSQPDNERQGIILNNQGVTQFQNGEAQEALKSFNRSAEIFPTNAIVHRNLGYLYRDLNDFNGAEAAFRNAIQIRR